MINAGNFCCSNLSNPVSFGLKRNNCIDLDVFVVFVFCETHMWHAVSHHICLHARQKNCFCTNHKNARSDSPSTGLNQEYFEVHSVLKIHFLFFFVDTLAMVYLLPDQPDRTLSNWRLVVKGIRTWVSSLIFHTTQPFNYWTKAKCKPIYGGVRAHQLLLAEPCNVPARQIT